ncbi:zinc knuckle CX2CX4HX4C containing protein [Tanacetum coccineum]|uniref:Zinc knuckle CX2CX4HX4C containing protein n=1 Tax=Tanacetum coccineum TaxID=301880 RepID=A0ABQ5J1D1_9ASTR
MNPSIASINPSAGAVGNILGEAGSNMDTTNATNGNGDASVVTSDPNTSSIRAQVDGVADLFGVSIKTLVDIDNFTKDLESGKYAMCMPKGAPISSDSVKSEFLDAPIVQSVIVHDKPNTYAGAAGGLKLEPNKSKANFRSQSPENLCEGATFSIPKNVVETADKNNDELQRFFFFKFKTSKGLDDVMENGPWMIRNSPIILKKWSMDTRLCKEELTR